ncbi:MAG: hypothetical protein LBV23_11395 [Deltaproteobacteria bacterium]|jgi:GGDEF domain-containing protein|nr:hypothetical protein [Deltaproteobacteria bacterium]
MIEEKQDLLVKAKNGLRKKNRTVKAQDQDLSLESKEATCLDLASGLYHPEHFSLTLRSELSRMERTEKPLGLMIIKLSDPAPEHFKALGAFFHSLLSPLDLAARLSLDEAVVLLPEANRDRALRLIKALEEAFDSPEGPLGEAHGFGMVLVRPFDGLGEEEILASARIKFRSASEVEAAMFQRGGPWAEVNTAVAAAERESLFSGFNSLSSFI